MRLATSQTVPGSIPGGVTGFFSDIFPSDRTMALGLTQPLVKMSTRNIPGGKGSMCVTVMTSPPSSAVCHEIWEPKPPGTLWATPGLLRDCFTFFYYNSDGHIMIQQQVLAFHIQRLMLPQPKLMHYLWIFHLRYWKNSELLLVRTEHVPSPLSSLISHYSYIYMCVCV
jgi:hypothetical protein